ncbi:MAG: alpha/beta hydrolase [Acidimicrobiales bacterium]
MKLWDDDLEAARQTIRAESEEFVGRMRAPEPDEGSASERVRASREAESAWVLRSDNAADRTINGPAGALRLREFRPEQVDGAMLHIHGGGWMTGSPEMMDLLNDAMSKALNLVIVSVDYRLAPENPYPAGPDDCEAAALWLVEKARAEYGTDRLLIGGESAGGHLSCVTLLRLRDRHEAADRFCGANLVFGAYDLSFPPSARGVGMKAGSDLLDPESMRFMVEQFVPGTTSEERRTPDLSPLFADLSGMPPALFTVGTADHLVDDSLFLATRWVTAGSSAELIVYPDAPHGCIGVPTVMSHWWPRLLGFLQSCLAKS